MNRNTSGCWTCRIRKKGDCNGPGETGDCSKCIELNIECLRGYGERLPQEWRSRYIVDEISKWTRRRNSRWLPAKLSLHDLLEQSQLRLAALTLDPLAGSSARPPPMPLGSLSTPSGAISSDYGSVPSSPEGSQQFAPVIPVMIRDPSNYMPAFGPTSFGPPQPGHHVHSNLNLNSYAAFDPPLDPPLSGPHGRVSEELASPCAAIHDMNEGLDFMSTWRGGPRTSAPNRPEWQAENAMPEDVSYTYSQTAGDDRFIQSDSQWRDPYHTTPAATGNSGYYYRVEDAGAARYGDPSLDTFPSPEEGTIHSLEARHLHTRAGARDSISAPAAYHTWLISQPHGEASSRHDGTFLHVHSEQMRRGHDSANPPDTDLQIHASDAQYPGCQ